MRERREVVDGVGLHLGDAPAHCLHVGDVGRGDPGLTQGVDRTVTVDVEDRGQRDPRHPEQLGGEAGAHLPGADQADPERLARLVEPLLQPVSIAHQFVSLLEVGGRVMRNASPTWRRGRSPVRTQTSPGSFASVRPSAFRSR
jgi:hypothetical protein